MSTLAAKGSAHKGQKRVSEIPVGVSDQTRDRTVIGRAFGLKIAFAFKLAKGFASGLT